MFSSVVGDSGGGGVSVTQGSGGGLLDVVALGDHGGGDGLLHNGLSLDSNGHGDIVGGVNMDGSWDLDDLGGVEGSVIGGIEWLVDEDGVLDLVDLLLDLDNGSIDSLCSPEDGGDSDGKVGSGGLQDPGGISGDIAGLAEVDLLGDDWGGLVDGGDALGLGVGGVGSRGGGLGIVDGVRHDGPGSVVLSSIGWNCGRESAYQLCGGTVGTSQEESKGHKRSHIARCLLLSC